MNRQVPVQKTYLIIGRGRLATHLARYFDLIDIPYKKWSRSESPEALRSLLAMSDLYLLAIKDSAIEPFAREWNLAPEKTLHFSGALTTPLAQRLHPLMSFAENTYSLEDYQKIAFVSETGRPGLSDLIPELTNPNYSLPADKFDLYHALCVLSGNGTVVLWQEIFRNFSMQLGLPPEILIPYMERIFQNLKNNPDTALTGPWIRRDLDTIQKNKTALEKDFLYDLYQSFTELVPPPDQGPQLN